MSPDGIADRLSAYSDRLRSGSITRAKALWSTWRSYNDSLNPLRSAEVPRHRGAGAVDLLASAALHESIIIIVRAFARPGRGGVLQTNRVSFPILAELSTINGVRDELEARARRWHPDGLREDENARGSMEALDRMVSRIDGLLVEDPNRQQRLRNFRDEFLAHNLEIEVKRESPVFRDITELLDELTHLSDDAEFAFSGNHLDWGVFNDQAKENAESLWEVIRRGAQA